MIHDALQDAIDPNYGNEAVAVLRKEISRLQHRYGELLREQERLVQEMERAVLKRDIISMKVGRGKGRPKGASSRAPPGWREAF